MASSDKGKDDWGHKVWDGMATVVSSTVSFLAGSNARLRNTQAQRYAPTVLLMSSSDDS